MSAFSSWSRRGVQPGLLALALLFSGPAQAVDPLTPALAARCPDKHLEWLNPGILIDGITSWMDSLPAGQRAANERKAKPALAKCEVGAGCVNAAYIRATTAMDALPGLAAAVCALPHQCSAPFTCDSGGH